MLGNLGGRNSHLGSILSQLEGRGYPYEHVTIIIVVETYCFAKFLIALCVSLFLAHAMLRKSGKHRYLRFSGPPVFVLAPLKSFSSVVLREYSRWVCAMST